MSVVVLGGNAVESFFVWTVDDQGPWGQTGASNAETFRDLSHQKALVCDASLQCPYMPIKADRWGGTMINVTRVRQSMIVPADWWSPDDVAPALCPGPKDENHDRVWVVSGNPWPSYCFCFLANVHTIKDGLTYNKPKPLSLSSRHPQSCSSGSPAM